MTSLVEPVAAVGALGYGYMWWKVCYCCSTSISCINTSSWWLEIFSLNIIVIGGIFFKLLV